MRVLVLSYMYPNPANDILGIFVEEQVKALAKQGCEVKVIAPVAYCPFPFSELTKGGENSKIPFLELRNGVEVYHPRYVTTSPSLIGDILLHLHGWLVYRGIKKLATKIIADFKPEIIHSHGVFPSGHAVALLKRDLRQSIRTVVTVHGSDINSVPFKNSLLAKKTIFSLSNNDVIVTVSAGLKNVAESLLSGNQIRVDNPIKVIPNGVDVSKFKLSGPDVGWVEEKKSLFKADKIFLFVGDVSESKGVRELLGAFKEISSYRDNLLLLLISRSNKMKDFLDSYVKGLNGKILPIGPVRHEELKLWMNLSDIFLLPSYKEGLPVSMLEAMACGKPVVISAVGGVTDVIKDGENGLLVEPRDTDSLIRAINFLLDSPDRARQLGERGRQAILSNYTWAKNAEKTMEVYKEVCSEFNQ